METEHELISRMRAELPGCESQINKPHESDSEIINTGDASIVFSIDNFSKEDLFIEDEPDVLGYNCTAAVLSDIHASGGTSSWYMHSMIIPRFWQDEYLSGFCRGIAEALKETSTSFIGGDTGRGDQWHYTGSVAGFLTGSPLLRSGAQKGDAVYITGPAGAGNLQAASGVLGKPVEHIPRFRSRKKESEYIRDYAGSCIDTSDGVFNALNILSDQSGTGYRIDTVPILESCRAAADSLSLPKEVFFFGECGEYELLFTIPSEKVTDFTEYAAEHFPETVRLGTVTKPGTRIIETENGIKDCRRFKTRARDTEDLTEYIDTLVRWLHS